MSPRGGPPGRRRGRAFLLVILLAAFGRLYDALLVLYPKAFRRRYSEEMRRDFRELLREGLQEGGTTELVRMLAQAFSDLVLTALKERGTLLARRYASYSCVDPRIAKRAAAGALFVVVLVALGVTSRSFLQPPTYEASAQVWVDQKPGDQQTYVTRSGEKIQTLPPRGEDMLQTIILLLIAALVSRSVAEEVIQRLELEMTPAELLDKLSVERVENKRFIVLTYEDTDPERAQQIVNTVGEVSSEFIFGRRAPASNITATMYDKALVPDSPASPHPLRNGLLTLVMGWALIGLVVLIHRSS